MQHTVRSAAKQLCCSFETAKRQNGDEYYLLTDGSPEWMKDLVYKAHGDFGPDDWRYECIYSAAQFIAENGEDADPGEFADSQVDVYTGRRTSWLASNLSRVSYCDTAAEEFDGATKSVADLIGWGQYYEASEVFGLVLQGLEEMAAVRP